MNSLACRLGMPAVCFFLPKQGTQPASNNKYRFERGVMEQEELALARAPHKVIVPMEMIRAKKNSGAAFTLACDASGLDDKEIYMALNIDAGYFSNIKKSKATLQGDLVRDFCKVVGNTIYPEWLAYQVGCALVMIKSEAERRAEAAERRAEEAERKYRTVVEAFGGRAA